jgi:hypothetical protein
MLASAQTVFVAAWTWSSCASIAVAGGGHGRIAVAMEDDQRQAAGRGRAGRDGPCFIAVNAEAMSLAAA